MSTLSKGFLGAQKMLETYKVHGHLEAQPRGGGFWVFDYWRDSMLQQWEITDIGEGLTEVEAVALGAFIHPNNRKKTTA